MLSAELLDKINFVAQAVRKSPEPFGGVQVVMCGDFFQLPPVCKQGDPHFAFEAHCWSQLVHRSFRLSRVFRQRNQEFVDLLNALRLGRIPPTCRKLLTSAGSALKQRGSDIQPTRLYATNKSVTRENLQRLAALPGHAKVYSAWDTGTEYGRKLIEKNCAAPATLSLKVGAQVLWRVLVGGWWCWMVLGGGQDCGVLFVAAGCWQPHGR